MKMQPLILALAVGCVPPAQSQFQERKAAFEAQLTGWIGKDINEAIRKMGPPNSEYPMPNGNRAYTWFHISQRMVAMPVGPAMVQQQVSRECRITLEASPEGAIKTWSASGNNCF